MATDDPRTSPSWALSARAWTALSLLSGAAASAALALALAGRVHAMLVEQPGPWRVESAVETGVAGVGALVALWLTGSALVAALCVAARVAGATWQAGERLVHRYAPQVVRKALVLAVGAGIGLGAATGAAAAAPTPTPAAYVSAGSSAPDDLGWVVTSTTPPPEASTPADWQVVGGTAEPMPTGARVPTAAAPAVPVPASAPFPPAAVDPESVVVATGDSLWAIAARHLPPGATDAQIAAAWPRWYESNRAVVGADPDVIHSGQVLVVPVAANEVSR